MRLAPAVLVPDVDRLCCRGEVKLKLAKKLRSSNTGKQRDEEMIFDVDQAMGPACDNHEVEYRAIDSANHKNNALNTRRAREYRQHARQKSRAMRMVGDRATKRPHSCAIVILGSCP